MKKKIFGLLAALMLVVPALQVSAGELPAGTSNLSYTFENVDGGEITTTSSGKPKMVILFSHTCGNCRATLSGIASSNWVKNDDMDICAIEFNGASVEQVKDYREANCAAADGYIQFAADSAGNAWSALWDYAEHLGVGNTVQFPLIFVVNADNEVRGVSSGYISASDLESNYLPLINSTPENPDDSQNPGDSENPDDSQNPDDSENPDESQKPAESEYTDHSENPDDSQNPGDTDRPDDSQDSNDSRDDDSDDSDNAPASNEPAVRKTPGMEYAEYLTTTAQTLLNTKEKEIVINTKTWTCFNRTMVDAIKNRSDVTVIVNYVYQGKPYVLTIPAGTDLTQLVDENGFVGFRYIEKVLNEKK